VYFTLQKIILKLNVLLTYLQYTFVVDHMIGSGQAMQGLSQYLKY